MHDAVMAEFGGSLADDNVEVEPVGDKVVASDPGMSLAATGNEITLEEAA